MYGAEQDIMTFSEFRDGNVPAGYEQLRILKEAEKQLPKNVKKYKYVLIVQFINIIF